MDRVAVFVDAGYLYAGGARSVSGNDGTGRSDITLNIPATVAYLTRQAEAVSQQKLLRIYWYDAALFSGRLATDHQILACTDNVKLRLGVMNGFGQQKGVDGKIITDLAQLSRNRAFADAVLLGGDEDLRPGVELAQEYGSRVHLLTIEGSAPSWALRREADTMTVLSREDLQAFISVAAPPAPVPEPQRESEVSSTPELVSLAAVAAPAPEVSPETEAVMQAEVKRYLTVLSPSEKLSLVTAMKAVSGVPAEHDGKLLASSRNTLGRPLSQPEKAGLRRLLRAELGL